MPAFSLAAALMLAAAPPALPAGAIRIENAHVRWIIGRDGRNLGIWARRSGMEIMRREPTSWFAVARKGDRGLTPDRVAMADGKLTLDFPGGAQAVLSVVTRPDAIVFTVERWRGDADEFTFANAPLTLDPEKDEPFAACALALNVRTNVLPLPGPANELGAHAYARLGIQGASAALVAGPTGGLRAQLKRTVSAAPDLPHSSVGGPWAMDARATRASYLFNHNGLGVADVPKWVATARAVGATQIDFHGGESFRFGDFAPSPKLYPRGRADLKAVIDGLHAQGLQAGLHTYAFFIDKKSPYVTPVPDKRLAFARTLTLAEPLTADADTVTVAESTQGLNATTGFFVPNSATLRIGDELITFTAASQSPPWRFTGCTRGALGTKSAAHAAGDKADHLKELFGLFLPDPDSTLFTEVADNTARMYNECGFDMIYLDALDGSFILAGGEWAWHYGSKFVFELCKRLQRPAIMEMSTFHHHLWCVRSRMGAWDCPRTGVKEFVDMHRVVNRANTRMFLPSQLGWWSIFGWDGVQPDRTMPDDLEYLLCKAVADDAGVAMMGFSPEVLAEAEGLQRHAELIRRYEEIRRTGAAPPALRRRLGEPRAEFTLVDGKPGKRAFAPVSYAKRTVEGPKAAWRVASPFPAQPARVRIEALLQVGPNKDPNRLLSAATLGSLTTPKCAPGVTLTVGVGPGPAAEGAVRLTAKNATAASNGAWCMVERLFNPAIDLTHKALGVWVHGDGKGAVLNLQLRSPENVTPGAAERYVRLDFTGWRRVELPEPESERLSTVAWPYAADRATWETNRTAAFGAAYKLYHPWVVYGSIGALGVWLNNVPANGETEVVIGAVEALPLVDGVVTYPSVTVAGRTLTFPVELQSGQWLEYEPGKPARVYSPSGKPLRQVEPTGEAPTLQSGANEVTFSCRENPSTPPRCRVTLQTRGKDLKF